MRWTLLFTAFFSSLLSVAQIGIKASVDKNNVGQNERIRYTIDISHAGGGEITQPSFSNFRVLSGPNQSSQTTIVNGVISQSRNIAFDIRPTATGTFTIEPSKLEVGGKVYTTQPITIKVSKSSPATTNRNLLARIKPSKREVYTGEQLILSYSILNRYNNMQPSDYELPEYKNFAAEEIKLKSNSWSKDQITYKGLNYREAILKKEVLFPQKSGDYELEPFSMTAQIGRGFFSYGEEIFVTSNRVRLKVKPLPSGQPANFSGGVGTFALEVTTDKTETEAHTPLTITVKVSGKGNLKLLEMPKPQFPPDFEVYDPKIRNNISARSSGVSGNRSLEYLVIPRHAGTYTIPAIGMSYFDTKKEKYVTLSSPAQTFVIEPGSEQTATVYQGADKNDVSMLNDDIRHIKSQGNLHVIGNGAFLSIGHLAGLCAPVVLFFLFVTGRKKWNARNKDVVKTRQRRASRMAIRQIKAAHAALQTTDDNAFYEAIEKALYGYLSDKMNLGTAALDLKVIENTLREKAIAEPTIAQTISLIDTCLMARYAPVSDQPRKEILGNTEAIINKLDQSL